MAQFIQYIVQLLYDLIPLICRPFLDNMAIRGPDIDYNNEEISNLPKVKRYMAKYIKNLNNVLYNLKLANTAINACKLKWYKRQTDIIGYICGTLSRAPINKKIIKIRE